jgi:hypothetical protein
VGEYTPSSAKFSFTGTPPYDLVLTSAESGTYTYSVNAGHYKLYDGETLQSFTDKTGAPGTIVMKLETPPYAASARIWNFGNSTLIWSDRIRATPAQCKQVTTSDFYADHPEYMIRDCGGQPMYLYNAYCLAVCAQELCPSPWRWPTYADYATIGSVTTAQINNATLCPGGYFNFSWQPENTEWGSTPSGNGNGRAFVAFDPDGTMRMWTHGAPTAYMNVRCVL